MAAYSFNKFISDTCLVDISWDGYSFTWIDPSASKMSKLDRFLISENQLELFPNLSGVVLDRHLSNHRPILLKELVVDCVPSPLEYFILGFLLMIFLN